MRRVISLIASFGCCAVLNGTAQQATDTSTFAQPPTGSWPTYNGDYSGRRYSPLTTINADNVGSLSLAWVSRIDAGSTRAA